jgi:CheY-like chemotaxis protein
LAREDVRAVTAENGEEGIRLAREERPIAIFLDVVMPEMDGWAVLNALKADPELAEIPVVMTTMLDERGKGQALGAVDYLMKPVDRARLLGIVKQYRRQKKSGPVLIVEDDATNREILARMLRKLGRKVEEASNGKDALSKVSESQPDLILLDLMLPIMDGLSFLRELRKVQAFRSIPVVVLTAKDLTEEDRQVLRGNVQKILQKGAYNRDELIRELAP